MKATTTAAIGLAAAVFITACVVLEDRLSEITTPEIAAAAITTGCTGGREFVEAATLSGQSNTRIILRQVLPNALPPIIVLASLMVATAILLESSLSFLGLGDPNVMSWGYMIGAARTVLRTAWWLSFIPGIAILLTVLALNLIGEGLNDALNPRLRKRTT